MRKRVAFTAVAAGLAVLFGLGIWAVGAGTGFFGLEALRREAAGERAPLSGARYVYQVDPEDWDVTGLDVAWINGDVELRPGAGRMIRIIETSGDWDLAPQEMLKLSSSGGTVKIGWSQHFLDLALLENRRKDLTVELPRELWDGVLRRVKCANTSGNISVSQALAGGRLELSSVSGSVTLPGFTGEEAALSTTSGDLTVEGLAVTGALEARTVSGAVSLANVRCQSAQVKTTSGPVAFQGAAEEFTARSVSAPVEAALGAAPKQAALSSVSGPLRLTLPPSQEGFRVRRETVSGQFTCDFPTTVDPAGKLLVGRGRGEISLTTTSGDVRLAAAR